MEANHAAPVCRLNSRLGHVELIGWICLCGTQIVTDPRLDALLSTQLAAAGVAPLNVENERQALLALSR